MRGLPELYHATKSPTIRARQLIELAKFLKLELPGTKKNRDLDERSTVRVHP